MPIISAFQSVRWPKKIAFSLWIHSKTDGSLHFRCGFADVSFKIRIFSALTKASFFLICFDVANRPNFLAGVLAGLPFSGGVRVPFLPRQGHTFLSCPYLSAIYPGRGFIRGVSWGLLGSSGVPWAPLGSPGLPWARLGSPGFSWAPLGSSGLPWVLLGSPGLPWRPTPPKPTQPLQKYQRFH